MKKIISSILCLMLAMLVLVGCGEDVIGEYINQYDKPTEKELLTYNLYIVCGDETSEAAKTFVRQRISDYTEKSKLRTNLNVVFCSAAEYDSIIRTATDVNSSYDSNAELTDVDKANKIPQADIFLITSAALMDDMVAANRVADLTTYFNGDYEYGKFNAQIAGSLMSASIIANKNYAIPNNYIVGDYTYLSININKAATTAPYFSEIDLQSKKAGVFGTEYFWLLVSGLGENPLNYITYAENSQIRNEALLSSAYTVIETAPDVASGETEYSYLLLNYEAAEKYNNDPSVKNKVDLTGITTMSDAILLYQNNSEKDKFLPGAKFNEIFKEIKTSAPLSADDKALLENKSDDYYNRIESEDATTSTYIFFDKEKCDYFGLNKNDYFTNCGLPQDNAVIKLWNAITAEGGNPSDYIKLINGSYDLKATIEAGDANGRNICNVLELPVATRNDVFSGAFAINSNVHDVERAMEVIYAINNDHTLHNYLQYGIPETNYTFVGDKEDGIIKRSTDSTSIYVMNPRYTGNVFGLYYCEELGWMPGIVDSAKKQNDESIYRP